VAADQRKANVQWRVTDEAGNPHNGIRDGVMLAVMMDLRDELQRLNCLLSCPNFTAIPTTLRSIRRNTAKPKEKK